MGQDILLYRREECPLQRINQDGFTTKSEGNLDVITSMIMLLVLIVIIVSGFQITRYMVTAAEVEDALAASNLASAVIDVEEYGKSHLIVIEDVERAFQIYRDALCYNLMLDENLNTSNRDILAAQVKIQEYIVYNVREQQIEIFILNGDGVIQTQQVGNVGEVFTPDNVRVECTTIYSRVGFSVTGLMGQEIDAEKEKSIDIVRYDSE